jgi:hypothetical protein
VRKTHTETDNRPGKHHAKRSQLNETILVGLKWKILTGRPRQLSGVNFLILGILLEGRFESHKRWDMAGWLARPQALHEVKQIDGIFLEHQEIHVSLEHVKEIRLQIRTEYNGYVGDLLLDEAGQPNITFQLDHRRFNDHHVWLEVENHLQKVWFKVAFAIQSRTNNSIPGSFSKRAAAKLSSNGNGKYSGLSLTGASYENGQREPPPMEKISCPPPNGVLHLVLANTTRMLFIDF